MAFQERSAIKSQEENEIRLREHFEAMCSASVTSNTRTEERQVASRLPDEPDDEGGGSDDDEPETVTVTILTVTVDLNFTGYMEAAEKLGFTEEDLKYCDEMTSPDYDPFWAMLLGIYIDDQYLVDSIKPCVAVREHWGIDGRTWKWAFFARVPASAADHAGSGDGGAD